MMRLNQNRAETAALIARLLAHYWTGTEPVEVRKVIAEDWLDDLADFTPAMVERACNEWRRLHRERPFIADIRKLCIEAQQVERERLAIEQHHSALDEETRKMWSRPEYHGDYRSPDQRRNDAIEAQEEKYRRGAAYRAGKLDEYDAKHWPERLAERRARQAAAPEPGAGDMRSVSDVLAGLGVTNQETTPPVTTTTEME